MIGVFALNNELEDCEEQGEVYRKSKKRTENLALQMKFLNFFNLSTLLIIILAIIAVYLTIAYNLRFELNLMLFSLAIGFPLAFSIQSAFRRRDKALEYLSLFKAASIALHNSFQISKDLGSEQRKRIEKILSEMVAQLIDQLENREAQYGLFQKKAAEVMSFIEMERDSLSGRNTLRMIRYLKDVTDSSAYLISLISHRTIFGLRLYAIIFIGVFPFIQAPIILYHLGDIFSTWVIYFSVIVSAIILVTLNNFQNMIEYPFDQDGFDNIQVRDFKIDVEE